MIQSDRRTLRYRLVVTEGGTEYRSQPWFDERADAIQASEQSELPCRIEPVWCHS